MGRSVLRPLIGLLTVAAIATVVLAQQQEEGSPEARAQLIDQQGNDVGEATFATTEDGVVRIRIQVRGLTAALEGERGLHIHEVGRCEPPKFESAGDHFNPTGAEHGLLHPDGPHAGDLPNMVFDADGNADFGVLTMRMTLGEGGHSLLGGNGTTLIIHVNPDDHVEGNTEDRIACGVIEAVAHGPGEPGGWRRAAGRAGRRGV
jgi:superoxide dismutase, Cu-Zn family